MPMNKVMTISINSFSGDFVPRDFNKKNQFKMRYLIIVTLLFLLGGCNTKQTSQEEHTHDVVGANTEAEHSHDEEVVTLSFTLFSDSLELFVEFPALVVGQTSAFAAHFTDLVTYRPLTTGKLTVSLIQGSKGLRSMVDGPSSPGIFRPALQPKEAGRGKLVFEIETEKGKTNFSTGELDIFTNGAESAKVKAETGAGDEITYLKEQAWKVEFANLPVIRQPFIEIIKTTGEILPAQGDEMVVTANTNGIITFSGNKTVIGTPVRAGEMLFAISGKTLTDGNSETRFTQAKVAYEKAKADYDRAHELTKDNIVSQKDFLEIKARYETEQANYNNLSRNYQSGGQKIVSPISGFIKNILVAEGQYVSVGQPIASVSQNRSLVLKAEVSQKYFSKLPLISSANFKTAYDDKTYSIESLNGKLLSYGKSNDANTLFIPVTFSFDNKGEVFPGSLVDVYLKLQPFDGAIIIPVSALIEEQGVFYAYVQTGGESFVKRELKMGGSDGIHVHVLSGLNEGERVVTKGAYQIKLATASGAIPAHGHAH